jgi:hypothetical protein
MGLHVNPMTAGIPSTSGAHTDPLDKACNLWPLLACPSAFNFRLFSGFCSFNPVHTQAGVTDTCGNWARGRGQLGQGGWGGGGGGKRVNKRGE